ncbi:MAG: DUF523 domain-containing protein [Solobacterium sp.]|nr:DUF523 domain-containing protein [Solobacterium sp.]
MSVILVSMCLLGCPCRYDGDSRRNERVLRLSAAHTLIPVCPEQMGGLPTPRIPGERQNDRVISAEGTDVTRQFRIGAETAFAIAKLTRAEAAVLKANSPSCGKGTIYDGTFTGNKKAGNGVTAELLLQNGIPVYTEEEDWPFEQL